MVKLIERLRSSKHHQGKYWLLFAFVWLLLDQITKQFVLHYLKPIGSYSIIGDLLRFTYAENTGMAFSISIFPSWVLFLIALLTSIFLTIWLWRVDSGFLQNLAFSLIIAGALGNAIDRMLYGYVVDFVDVDFPDWIMQRWPIFNLADSGITISIFLLLIASLSSKKVESIQQSSHK